MRKIKDLFIILIKDIRDNWKEYLELAVVGLFISLSILFVWRTLELYFYGEVNENKVDTMIGYILNFSLLLNYVLIKILLKIGKEKKDKCENKVTLAITLKEKEDEKVVEVKDVVIDNCSMISIPKNCKLEIFKSNS